jgi:tricorn protease
MRKFVALVLPILLGTGLSAQDRPLWLRYPALSPDGKTIVFSYQGDLFRVASSGGTATPLTVGGAYAFRPVWSHDGRWIAFASDRSGNFDVYVMPSEGGEARRLTFHSAPDLPSAFTPDDRAILFTSPRGHGKADRQFPGRLFPETYLVERESGTTRLLTDTTLEWASYAPKGDRILFQDLKGYEDPYRKHHTSAVTRDVWSFTPSSNAFARLTTYEGEDRNPVLTPDGDHFFYLSERGGSFNVYRSSVAHPNEAEAVTHFSKHPVRFLTAAQDGTLCYSWDGEIYTQAAGAEPRRLQVAVKVDGRATLDRPQALSGAITEMRVAPSGKEVAFVVRGQIFVTSADGKTTRRISSTPGQERWVSFSPDGRTLLYAAERNGNWTLYTKHLARTEEEHFYASTRLEEKAILGGDKVAFQPVFSPDGKEVAYLEERTILKVLNLVSGKTRTILAEGRNYSYADGDQSFGWSPDGTWLTFAMNTGLNGQRNVGLAPADGSGPVRNLTHSGFDADSPRFSRDGSMIYWFSTLQGNRNLGNDPETGDIYGLFLTPKAWDRFRLTKEEFALVKEQEDKTEKEARKKNKEEPAKDPKAPVTIVWENQDDRKARLTTHACDLQAAEADGKLEKLYYLTKFDKGYDIWSEDLRTHDNRQILKIGAEHQVDLQLTEDGKALFVLADGRLLSIDPESGKREDLPVASEMVLRPAQERAYIFDHAWKQVDRKFYVTDLHHVDWPSYRDAYRRFLPYIQNNYDFQELLSEMLGELNASHTGGRYTPPQVNTDATAALGLFLQPAGDKGLQIAEVLKGGPVDKAVSKVRAGHLLCAVDGTPVHHLEDLAQALNRRAGLPTLLTFQDPAVQGTWDEVVKPVNPGQENELLYHRWVEINRQETDRLSKGRLGYIHVRAMDDQSMRDVVNEALGRFLDKDALVVDTRFNGGGNIHEQLSDFLSGRKYFDVVPRGLLYGHEPNFKWIKPSIVLMSEGNYSDAHLFPVAYKAKGLGKTVGMPVPGTGTFVWWEQQIDPTLIFGIPQGGWRTQDGKFCENTQLEPDIRVMHDPAQLTGGRDAQLEAAVTALIQDLDGRK